MYPNSFGRQVALVFNRTMHDGLRNFPLAFVAPTLLAAFVAALFGAVFNGVVDTTGFPTDRFIDWIAPATVLLSAFVGAGYAAGALLRDIETGYLDRLRTLPIHPAAIVVGRAAFEGVRIIGPACVVLTGTLLFGARNNNGVAGFVAIVLITIVVAVAWNGVFFLTAITTQNSAAVLGLQPLFMPIVMFSTFFAPTSFMPRWFKTVVQVNPFTHTLDGARSILRADLDSAALAIGLGAFILIGILTYSVAARAYAGLVQAD